MSSLAHEIQSEMAYDLLQDHLETILSLLEQPLPRTEVLERLGSDRTLDRLVKHGLIVAEGQQLRAASNVYHQLRQEGMINFLERYIIPSLNATVQDDGHVTLVNLPVRLTDSEIVQLRQGPVQGMFETLVQAFQDDAEGVVSRLTVLVIGTSNVLTDDMDDGDSALFHAQQASLQRSDPDQRDLAVLTQLDSLADNTRYKATLSAIDSFVDRFEKKRASSNEEATYHLTVASHWRSANASSNALDDSTLGGRRTEC